MKFHISMFAVLFFGSMALGSWYLWSQLVSMLPWKSRKIKIFWALLLVAFWGLIFWVQLAFHSIPNQISGSIFYLCYGLLGVWAIFIMGMAFFDVLRFPFWFKGRRTPLKSFFMPDRREFLTTMKDVGVASFTLGSSASGSADFFLMPKVEKLEIPLRPEHKFMSGFSIVQVTDIHIGPLLKKDFAQFIVDTTNALSPDLVAVTGDLADGSPEELELDIAPFKNFKSRLGTVYCPGNHEIYSGHERWMKAAADLGWRVHLNTHEVLEVNGGPLAIGGVYDYSIDRHFPELTSSPLKAFENAPANAYRLLLAHQPRNCYEAQTAGTHLQLSGHTHGGQFFPWSLVVYLAHPYVKGLHEHSDNFFVYVSKGTGWWGPPNRFGVPAEITHITFV